MKINRRTLLKAATAATLAPSLPTLAAPEPKPHAIPYPENGTLIPDEGWHLWLDTAAPWQEDDIFLPEDITWLGEGSDRKLCAKGHPLPTNAPTGGWSTLTPATAKSVTLPTTVEQHFWGQHGAGDDGHPRPYTPEEYRYAAPHPPPQNSFIAPTQNSVIGPTQNSVLGPPQNSVIAPPQNSVIAPTQNSVIAPPQNSVILSGALASSASAQSKDLHNRQPGTPAQPLSATEPAAPLNPPPADDFIPQNGAYFGVSWFYRPIDIPTQMRGKRIFLHIRGAHLRAEVYLNGHLCGYSIMEELPFEADLTQAARFSENGGAAENLLAIRITNPFGRFDWVDGLNAKWNHVSLYRSHGFGGIDRGMTIRAESAVQIKSAWALNTPIARTLAVFLEIEGEPANVHRVRPRFAYQLSEGSSPQIVHSIHPTSVEGQWLSQGSTGRTKVLTAEISFPEVKLWDLETPHLYQLSLIIDTELPEGPPVAARDICVGFRSFTVDGLGPAAGKPDALFRLNGRRIRIYTSISWGFWGLNGMFPIPELAVKEVTAAKALGLNCLNFHRNLAKEEVLRAHDQLGLLRYMEPGAGKLAIGKLPAHTDPAMHSTVMEDAHTEAEKFAQRYMFVKCVEMVKAYRSHPSVIEYCLQNEIGADLKNPVTLAILQAMHDEDPSRCVVLNDGFVARGAAQAWYEPWSSDLKSQSPHSNLEPSTSNLAEGKLHRSDEEKWGGWWNNHQGAGDQWYDQFYKSPTDYTYNVAFKDVLTEYGEMEGCARPDNHPLMVHQITETYKKYGGDSYDLQDHEEIIAGYERFLDRWNFRKAFPTSEHLFRALGLTCYQSWQNYMENARINDALDFAAISGWESTAIENHSGIVDNLRNHKSDPNLIRGSLLPIRPIAKQRALAIEQGKPATFDLYLANDTSKPATGTLTFTMITPSNKKLDLITLPAPTQSPDVFSYLLKEAFTTPPLIEEGLYRFKFSISSEPLATQTKELWTTRAYPENYECKALRVAVSGIPTALRKQLEALGCVEVFDFKPGERYGAIISSGITSHTSTNTNIGETTGESLPVMKPGHTPEPGETPTPTQLGHLQHGILEAVAAGTPLLAIPQADTLSEGVAQQLASAGAFTYHGPVGDFRAPWMGNWYFVREHPLFAGLPTNCAMGNFYQIPGRPSNGLLVDGPNVEIIAAYSRDHDRQIGAGTFTTKLGQTKILYHRIPDMHPVLQQRFLANALRWLTT